MANSLCVELVDGTTLEETVEYPLGHKRPRAEGIPLCEWGTENFREQIVPLQLQSYATSRGLAA
jgi:2-methylcitrate dehydratase PrpD